MVSDEILERGWTVHQESNIVPAIPLLKFDVNRDFVIIENVEGDVEIWLIRDTVPKEIRLPWFDTFEDRHMLVGEGEKFLVALFSTNCSFNCEASHDEFKFFLVYESFEKEFIPKNLLHRITFPKRDHVVKVELTEVDVGNGHFKTVLVAECTTRIGYYYTIYDLNTGELVETVTNDGWQSVINGSFVFSTDEYCLMNSESGVYISRINWNEAEWSVSTQFIQFPNVGTKYSTLSISNVTDTCVSWNLPGDLIMVCDYLLS